MAERVETIWRDAFGSWWAIKRPEIYLLSPEASSKISYGAGYEQGCAISAITAIIAKTEGYAAELQADVKRLREMLEKPQ